MIRKNEGHRTRRGAERSAERRAERGGERRAERGSDAGLSLIELVVTMSVMAVFMAMFTVGTVQMFRSANHNEAMSVAESQINNAFLRLDKEVRYATGVSKPGTVGGDPYVEFLTSVDGTPVCTELRLNVSAEQLQRRTWTQGATPLSPSPWIPVASFVGSGTPFTTSVADTTFGFQRLRLQLTAHSGTGTTMRTAQMDVTFTALNTSLGTTSDSVCTEGRAVA